MVAIVRLSETRTIIETLEEEREEPFDLAAIEKRLRERELDLQLEQIRQRAQRDYEERRGPTWTWENSPFNPNRPHHTRSCGVGRADLFRDGDRD